jgi:hypothetical protein
LKCNLNIKPKSWIRNLAFEAETAINSLPIGGQDHIRWQVAKNIDHLYNSRNIINQNTKNEQGIILQIVTKLKKDAMIVKADKGNYTF